MCSCINSICYSYRGTPLPCMRRFSILQVMRSMASETFSGSSQSPNGEKTSSMWQSEYILVQSVCSTIYFDSCTASFSKRYARQSPLKMYLAKNINTIMIASTPSVSSYQLSRSPSASFLKSCVKRSVISYSKGPQVFLNCLCLMRTIGSGGFPRVTIESPRQYRLMALTLLVHSIAQIPPFPNQGYLG